MTTHHHKQKHEAESIKPEYESQVTEVTKTETFVSTSAPLSRNRITNAISKRKFTLIFVLLIAIILGTIGMKSYQPPQTPTIVKKTIIKQAVIRRSKDLGIIQRSLTGKAVDVNTGKIVTAARIFSPNDKTVYLELDFLSATKGTVVDYIRYKNGRYVDHGEVVVAKSDTKNLLFNWTITKLLGASRDGKWKIATYTNGVLAKKILYEISSNKVSYVYPEENISPTNSEYHLNNILAANHAH